MATLDKITGNCSTCPSGSDCSKRFESINTEIHSLRYILLGIDGTNGLRSDVKKIAADVDALRKLAWILIGAVGIANVTVPYIIKFMDK